MSERIRAFIVENNLDEHGGTSIAIRSLIERGFQGFDGVQGNVFKSAFKEGFSQGYKTVMRAFMTTAAAYKDEAS